MTREEAIEVIKAYKDKLTNSASNQLDGDIEAFDMAIKELENKPRFLVHSDGKIEQIIEPCDDVLNKITGELKTVKEKWWYGVDNDCFMKLSDVIAVIDKYKTESEANNG